jgi:hypothetical protein
VAIDTTYRVVRFLVYDEPIWRFDERVQIAEATDHPELHQVGDHNVTSCNRGLLIHLAVSPFDEFSVALTDYGQGWRNTAVIALKCHIRGQTPCGSLRILRDPIDGSLRNLAE